MYPGWTRLTRVTVLALSISACSFDSDDDVSTSQVLNQTSSQSDAGSSDRTPEPTVQELARIYENVLVSNDAEAALERLTIAIQSAKYQEAVAELSFFVGKEPTDSNKEQLATLATTLSSLVARPTGNASSLATLIENYLTVAGLSYIAIPDSELRILEVMAQERGNWYKWRMNNRGSGYKGSHRAFYAPRSGMPEFEKSLVKAEIALNPASTVRSRSQQLIVDYLDRYFRSVDITKAFLDPSIASNSEILLHTLMLSAISFGRDENDRAISSYFNDTQWSKLSQSVFPWLWQGFGDVGSLRYRSADQDLSLAQAQNLRFDKNLLYSTFLANAAQPASLENYIKDSRYYTYSGADLLAETNPIETRADLWSSLVENLTRQNPSDAMIMAFLASYPVTQDQEVVYDPSNRQQSTYIRNLLGDPITSAPRIYRYIDTLDWMGYMIYTGVIPGRGVFDSIHQSKDYYDSKRFQDVAIGEFAPSIFTFAPREGELSKSVLAAIGCSKQHRSVPGIEDVEAAHKPCATLTGVYSKILGPLFYMLANEPVRNSLSSCKKFLDSPASANPSARYCGVYALPELISNRPMMDAVKQFDSTQANFFNSITKIALPDPIPDSIIQPNLYYLLPRSTNDQTITSRTLPRVAVCARQTNAGLFTKGVTDTLAASKTVYFSRLAYERLVGPIVTNVDLFQFNLDALNLARPTDFCGDKVNDFKEYFDVIDQFNLLENFGVTIIE